MPGIDTSNQFMVAVQGKHVRILRQVPPMMSADEAMNLAAYLVCMAEMDATHKFEDVLTAVQNT